MRREPITPIVGYDCLRKMPMRRPNAFVAAGIAVIVGAAVALAVCGRGSAPVATTTATGSAEKPRTRVPERPSLPGAPTGPRLTGFVVDGAGLPVPAVEVSAEPEQGAARASGSAALPVAAQTDGAGHFVLGGLTPGRYRVRVHGAGLLDAEVRFVPVPSDEARIVVARQIAIDGTVTDGGQPVPGATVGVRGDAIGGALEVTTDARGAFHAGNLPEGRYQVYAYKDALAARAIRANRLGAGPFAPLELRLEAGAVVVGRVIDRGEGTGIAAAIELRPSGDDQAPRYARSGDDGVFRIAGVPNGTWIADAYAPGYTSPGGVELEAGKGVAELALARGAAIEGRVVDADGRPIAGATVRALGPNQTEYSADIDQDHLRRFSGDTAAPEPQAHATSADPLLVPRGELGVMVGPIPPLPLPGEQIAQTAAVVDPKAATALVGEPAPLPPVDPARASIWTTGADGRFRIAGIAPGRVTALAVAADFAEGRSRAIDLDAGQVVTGIDIVLGAGTYIAGRVTDDHGAPLAGAEVAAEPEVGEPTQAFTGDDGAFRIGPVSGKLVLHASAYGHVDARVPLELALATGTAAAEQHQDLQLETADATLLGTVADSAGMPVGAARVEVVGGVGEGRGATSAPDGTFAIQMLPRGEVRVRVAATGYPTQELAATASATGERVRLVIQLGGAVEGVLLDARSGDPLGGVTLTGSGPAGASADATTAANGRWKLGPLVAGAWRIQIAQPGYLTLAHDVDVPAASSPGATSVRDVRLEIARGSLLGGTVRDDRGQRVPNAHVVCRSATAEVAGDADGQGEFRIHDAPTGDVDVIATKGDAAGSTHVIVNAGDEVLGLALEIR